MNIVNLREDREKPNHWYCEIDGVETCVVTRPGQDPLEVINESCKDSLPTYKDLRVSEYPSINEQLDMIYHDIEKWKERISEIKVKYPKPSNND